MEILIKIKEKEIRLVLIKDKKEADSSIIPDEYKLSENLLPQIDKILKKNKLKPENVEILVESDQGDNFTTTRIAKSTANAWNWGIKINK